jgi:hypothetical protein
VRLSLSLLPWNIALCKLSTEKTGQEAKVIGPTSCAARL